MASRRLMSLILVLAIAGIANATFTVDDIAYWVGSGSNEAGFVIDWNGGKNPASLAWGYRWNGEATGADMLKAIVTADSRLFARVSSLSAGANPYGLGYDLDNDGSFGISDGTTFPLSGLVEGAYNDGTTPTDIADQWSEGWMSAGYWSYFLAGVNPYSGAGVWDYSLIGMSDRALANNCWDGWSWAPAPTWDGGAPDEPVAAEIPEPMTIALLGLGGLLIRRRRA
jgi:hypothetical protein